MDCIRKIISDTLLDENEVFMTIWNCRTHVRMTSMTSSVERTDLDFKISVALVDTNHFFYAHNFEAVEGAYWFVCVCPLRFPYGKQWLEIGS